MATTAVQDTHSFASSVEHIPDITCWLFGTFPKGSTIAVDATLYSCGLCSCKG